MSYQQEYQASIEDPESFWAEKVKLVPWFLFALRKTFYLEKQLFEGSYF